MIYKRKLKYSFLSNYNSLYLHRDNYILSFPETYF